MKNIFRREVLIGALVVVALLILFFGINFLKGVNIFKAANYYYASYTDVAGLAQSAPVTLNGYKIGIVRDIHYDYNNPGHVTVELSVDKALKLPVGTKAVVSSDILGTASVVLSLGSPANGFYAVGDTISSASDPGMMAALGETLLPSVNSVIAKVDTLLSGLNTIVSDPSLKTSVGRLDDITAELNATLSSLHAVMSQMGPVANDLKNITENVDTITGDLAVVTGKFREVPVDSLLNNVQATMANLEKLTAQLNNPDSSIGKLTNDPELYNNLTAATASLDSLFVDIKKNPKRYINIKVF
ncbi:MAG: MlaD family protein [Muribaculaceae bacterium]|nr:MlaD family protein [Muribaculaceae bacterium]